MESVAVEWLASVGLCLRPETCLYILFLGSSLTFISPWDTNAHRHCNSLFKNVVTYQQHHGPAKVRR